MDQSEIKNYLRDIITKTPTNPVGSILDALEDVCLDEADRYARYQQIVNERRWVILTEGVNAANKTFYDYTKQQKTQQ